MSMVVALPIEIKQRELDGKLLLSLALANNGYKVAIGQLGRIKNGIDLIGPDIYIACNTLSSAKKEHLFSELSEHGCTVALLDTEGGIFSSPDKYRNRLSENLLKYLDIYFAWGGRSADIFPINTFTDTDVVISGNPRFDLLTREYRDYYQCEVDSIQKEFSKYILFCTNFSSVNHFDDDLRDSILKSHNLSNESSQRNGQELVFNHYLKAIDNISRNQTVIVRPHPSENHKTYVSEFKGNDNVYVRSEGESIPWILGSQAMIHKNSTTGIEALLLNTPVRSFDPLPEKVSSNIAYQISPKVHSLGDLKEFVKNPTELGSDLSYLNEYIDTTTLSIERILTKLNQTKHYNSDSHMISPPKKERVRRVLYNLNLVDIVRTIKRPISDISKIEYSNQKFDRLKREEVKQKVERMCDVSQYRSPIIELIPQLPNCFWIKPNKTV